jgi:hypothetical protein
MKLRFHSRAGHLVPLFQRSGQPAQYVGREFVPPVPGEHAGAYRPMTKPYEVESLTGGPPERARNRAKLMNRLRKLCRRDGSILPADEVTARACGVPWVEPEQLPSGEWQIKNYVAGWADWPNRTPDKLAEDLTKQKKNSGVKAQLFERAKRGGRPEVEEVADHG